MAKKGSKPAGKWEIVDDWELAVSVSGAREAATPEAEARAARKTWETAVAAEKARAEADRLALAAAAEKARQEVERLKRYGQ